MPITGQYRKIPNSRNGGKCVALSLVYVCRARARLGARASCHGEVTAPYISVFEHESVSLRLREDPCTSPFKHHSITSELNF